MAKEQKTKEDLEEERKQQVFNLGMNSKNIRTEPAKKRRSRGEPAKDLD